MSAVAAARPGPKPAPMRNPAASSEPKVGLAANQNMATAVPIADGTITARRPQRSLAAPPASDPAMKPTEITVMIRLIWL